MVNRTMPSASMAGAKPNVSIISALVAANGSGSRTMACQVMPSTFTGFFSLGLGLLLRGRDGSDLLHQAQSIPVLPLLHDLAGFNTMDSDPSDSHLIARGSDAHQFALVRTLCPPTADNLVPFGYIVLERYVQIGEGGTYHGDELRQTLDATNIFVGFVHNDGVSVHLLEGIL